MNPANRRWRCAGGWLAWLLGLVAVVPGSAATSVEARLLRGSWRLQSPVAEAEGMLEALVDASGRWRIDLAVVDHGAPDATVQLRQRLGDGWTLAGAGGEGGLLQPWHAPWRRLDERTARAIGALLQRWADGPSQQVRGDDRRRWRPTRPGESTQLHWPDPQILWTRGVRDDLPPEAAVAAKDDWRRRLVVRGRGRGGDELRLQLRWEGRGLVVTTSRWPGRLEFGPVGAVGVAVPTEAFLVLWPLQEVLP